MAPNKSRCFMVVLEEKISDGFAAYGRFACRHPWPLVLVPIFLLGGLGAGLIRINTLTNTEEVFTPMNSQARKDKETIATTFPESSATAFQLQNLVTLGRFIEILGQSKSHEDNILTDAYFDQIANLSDFVQNIQVQKDGQSYQFSTLCAKSKGSCVIGGEALLKPAFRSLIRAGNISFPTVLVDGAEVEVNDILGGLTRTTNTVTAARFFKLRFNLRQDEAMDAASQALEDKFIEEISKVTFGNLDITYSMSRSLDEELQGSISGDITFFSLTFTLMITYVSVISMTTNMVASRANLARLGVLSTGLGLVGGLGLVCATGLDFVQIIGITPFLVIGVGIDDVFVLLSGLAGSYEKDPSLPKTEENGQATGGTDGRGEVEHRISKTLKTSGVAITITTLTNVIALSVGASSVFLSVRNFSVYTGVCFLLAYLNHLTFFTGCMVLHERRVQQARHEMACHKRAPHPTTAKSEGRSCCFVLCCTGSIPTNRDEVENLAERLPRLVLTRVLLLKPAKAVVLVTFAALLGVGIWGVTRFQSGLELRDLAVDGSYYKTYDTWSADYFERLEPVTVVLKGQLDYRSSTVPSQISDLMTKLKQDPDVDDAFELNWLRDFQTSPFFTNTSLSTFVSALRTSFLPAYSHYRNDVVFSSDNVSIVASRFYVRTQNLKQSESQAAAMLRLRDISSSSALDAIVFAPGYVFYEQYVVIVPSTLQTVGVGGGAVFLVTVLFMPSPLLILYVTISLGAVLTTIFGYMHFWGLTLSSVTMIHIIMSVGFSVDFVSHTCHAYLVAQGNDRTEKVKNALNKVAGPITHGAVSSVLGLLTLTFSKSFIFRSFFQVMFLVVILGVGYALLLLPVILSFIGPLSGNSGSRPHSAVGPKNDRFQLSVPSTPYKSSHEVHVTPPPDYD